MKHSMLATEDQQLLCSVHGCNSKITRKSTESEVIFHNIPFGRSQEFLKLWINAIKLPSRVVSGMLVCSRHFLPHDYQIIDGIKVLKPDSVPSQNLPKVWRNKFTPRNYGRLIKLIEVRGIGRLRLCFEAKLSRLYWRKQLERKSRRKENPANRKSEIFNQNAKSDSLPKKISSPSEERTTDEGKIIEIVDAPGDEHCLTSEIEIKEEPLSGAEEQPEEEETVEEMLARMNADFPADQQRSLEEKNDRMEADCDIEWVHSSCEKCGRDDCDCRSDRQRSVWYCGPCDRSFPSQSELHDHNLSEHTYSNTTSPGGAGAVRRESPTQHLCSFCHRPVAPGQLDEHMATLHSTTNKKPPPSSPPPLPADLQLKCMLCEESFHFQEELIFHINSRHSNPNHKYMCRMCGETFRQSDDLDCHVRSDHRLSVPEYSCRSCGQRFNSKHKCWAHLNSHLRAKSIQSSSYPCEVCGRVLASRSTLKEHMLLHSGEKPYECQLCGKKIRHRANLIFHVQGHSLLTSSRLCQICGLSFSKESELAAHTAAEHPTDLPYLCIICGMRFRTEARFLKHAVSHDARLEDET